MNGGIALTSGQGDQSQTYIQKVKKMTPAIQNEIRTMSEQEALEHSHNLALIFKKQIPWPENLERPRLIVGLDLGLGSWHAALMGRGRTSVRPVYSPGKGQALVALIRKAMARLGVTDTRQVVACHEAGRDGRWVYDYLNASGIPCVILSADVLCDGQKKKKTDRVDAAWLAQRLSRFYDGFLECDHVVIPADDEVLNLRAITRARADAVEMRKTFSNRFKSVMARHGEVPPKLKIRDVDVPSLRDALGRPYPPEELAELEGLKRDYIAKADEVAGTDRKLEERMEAAKAAMKEGVPAPRLDAIACRLATVKGVGTLTAYVMACELYFKSFRTTRQVGSATGLVDVPRASGGTNRSAGISRRSYNRLRGLLVELAWRWLRYQPGSALAKWFAERTEKGVSARRLRKVAAVAVARKLAVALWKFLECGEVPDGAVLHAA